MYLHPGFITGAGRLFPLLEHASERFLHLFWDRSHLRRSRLRRPCPRGKPQSLRCSVSKPDNSTVLVNNTLFADTAWVT